MNLHNQIHKDLVVEQRQNGQPGKQGSFIMIQSSKEIDNTELAANCVREIDSYYRGEPTSEKYSVELLRRAIARGESEAWKWIEQCYSEPISNWLGCHPQWEIATKLGSKEQYVARTTKRFKQMTILNKHIECVSIADAFRYLRVCLNGVILDRLRFYSCSKENPS
jgi:hypothetical protein